PAGRSGCHGPERRAGPPAAGVAGVPAPGGAAAGLRLGAQVAAPGLHRAPAAPVCPAGGAGGGARLRAVGDSTGGPVSGVAAAAAVAAAPERAAAAEPGAVGQPVPGHAGRRKN
nr:hypothetical protein [Tanacetum cinerariifolium]